MDAPMFKMIVKLNNGAMKSGCIKMWMLGVVAAGLFGCSGGSNGDEPQPQPEPGTEPEAEAVEIKLNVGMAELDAEGRGISRATDYYFVLEDGTEVWLNAESSLRYPNRFEGSRREVELQGEGFFKVARDTARPFVVKAGGLVTEVLGTEFNVRTYKREDSHVTLLKGSVRVKEEGQAEGVIIQPGEDARWRGDGTFEVKEVDTDNYYLWTEGYFYFDNEPLVEIARELGRWYNADVVFNNPDAMAYRLHFLAEREQSVEEVLGLLNLMGKVKATFSNNKIVIE